MCLVCTDHYFTMHNVILSHLNHTVMSHALSLCLTEACCVCIIIHNICCPLIRCHAVVSDIAVNLSMLF